MRRYSYDHYKHPNITNDFVTSRRLDEEIKLAFQNSSDLSNLSDKETDNHTYVSSSVFNSIFNFPSKNVEPFKNQFDFAQSKNKFMEHFYEDELNSSNLSTAGNSRKASGEFSFKAKFKTEMCKFWELNKTCRFGDSCAFAHGLGEIRQKVVFSNTYKTKRCKQFFESGYCLYGTRCQFLHFFSQKGCIFFSYKRALKSYSETCNLSKEVRQLEVFTRIKSKFRQESLHSSGDCIAVHD